MFVLGPHFSGMLEPPFLVRLLPVIGYMGMVLGMVWMLRIARRPRGAGTVHLAAQRALGRAA